MTPLKTEVESILGSHKIFLSCSFLSNCQFSLAVRNPDVQETSVGTKLPCDFFTESLVIDLCHETHSSRSLPHNFYFEHKSVTPQLNWT